MGKRNRPNRSHNWHGERTPVIFLVRALNGKWHEVHPRLYMVHVAYGRLVPQIPKRPSKTVRAYLAEGYDVYVDILTGALRLRCLNTRESYPIASSWRSVENNFIFAAGRLTIEQRKAAIDEECLFLNRENAKAIASDGWMPLWEWLKSIGYIDKDACPPVGGRIGQASRAFDLIPD